MPAPTDRHVGFLPRLLYPAVHAQKNQTRQNDPTRGRLATNPSEKRLLPIISAIPEMLFLVAAQSLTKMELMMASGNPSWFSAPPGFSGSAVQPVREPPPY